ncbi:MAG: hypothetical protein K2O12_01010 [Muribaculaceae bacterium]|nr:hypothetical protein [Muribaculaceae bacterium]
MAQTSIASKQAVIDSLNSVLAYRRTDDSTALQISPEIKVLFPQISDIAISRAVFSNIDSMNIDTTYVAMIAFSQPMPKTKSAELERYLKARLRLRELSIVEVPRQTAEH